MLTTSAGARAGYSRGMPERADAAELGPDYHSLPPRVPLSETFPSVDPDPAPDPEAGQSPELRRALHDH